MPIRLRDRASVVEFEGSMPYFAIDVQIHPVDEVSAPSEMADHMLFLQGFYGPSVGMNPGAARRKDCVSLFSYLKRKTMVAEKYPVRHFLGIQQALGDGELENAYWLPGPENPVDGLTKVRSNVNPLMRLPESGRFNPGRLRPPTGVAWREWGVHVTHRNSSRMRAFTFGRTDTG